ncbi:MAG: AI-2E family transporter [Chitinophagales bacterium]
MQKKFIPQLFFLLLLLGVTLLFFGLIQTFLLTTFWAIILALTFQKPYEKIRAKLNGKDNLATVLMLLIILLVVVLPLFFIGVALVNESVHFYEQLQSGELQVDTIINWVKERIPMAQDLLQQVGMSFEQIQESVKTAAITATKTLANSALGITQNILTMVVNFFLMLYLLFFFLKDGKEIIRRIVETLPMGDEREYQLLHRFANVARATLKGSLIVALVQGTIGGVLFWAVGIEGSVFWGTIMTVLSLLPAVGSALVWGPAAIVFFINGSILKGVIVVLVGVLVIGLVDNILRPILVGRDTKLPDYLILVSTLGGITWLGLSGFVIGPCIAALFITCWDIFGKEQREVAALEQEPLNEEEHSEES